MKKNGFTLTEMIAVIVIIGIVSLLYKIIIIKRELRLEKEEWDKYLSEIKS